MGQRGPDANAPGPPPVLVATKLHPPALRAQLAPREELIERLVAGADTKLALVCAPAGWGKTVLLGEWQASPAEQRPFGWVSLDPGDDDPVRFWSYAIGALQAVAPELGAGALAALPTAGAGLVDAVLPPLVNDLAAQPHRLVLVLDDYHFVRNQLIQDSVAFLLRHCPRTLQLAIATRADPPLALAGLRAAGEVTELRAADLRFSDAEADELLNGSLGLELEPGEIELLQHRTEGWAAGLQLAALSIRAADDRHGFVAAFAGDDRQIGDYLHELLAEQPSSLRDFLLRTSILERLSAPLCAAVTGRGDSRELLREIHRAGLFLFELDTRGHWYRYHHLFRDLLRTELARGEPELEPELHRRAAAWHLGAGEPDEAIAHTTAAGDFGDAGELIARHWRPYFDSGQAETVGRWIAALPGDAVLADARLCLVHASVSLDLGRLADAERSLRSAERAPLPGPFHDGTTSVEANVARLEAARASLAGDVAGAIAAARRALALHARGPDRAIANINLGHALYYAGDLAGAQAALTEAMRAPPGERPVGLETTLGALALAQLDAGDPDSGARAVADAEQLLDELALSESAWSALTLLARGKLDELHADRASAAAAYARAALLAERGGRRLDQAHALLLQARVTRHGRDHTDGRRLAREARRLLATCPDPGAMLGDLLAATERALQLTAANRRAPRATTDPELSSRELDVLRLLASELSQREIGSELFVSFNTVKGHTRSIFRKLNVASRADAVARGRELGLI